MNALAEKALQSLAFGRFVFDPNRRLLLQDGQPVRLGSHALALLDLLVARRGQIVSKRHLLAAAWPGRVVDDGNLKVAIAALRKALGEDVDQPQYIATVVGRGYRFVSELQVADHPLAPGPLPMPVFGRQEIVSSILQELETTRLVTLVAPGGTGKTTVALSLAQLAKGSFPDGVAFFDLGSVATAAEVDGVVAKAVGLTGEHVSDGVLGVLGNRRMLLIFDNCEHVLEPVAQWVDAITTRTPQVKLLATSREPLCVRGERVRKLAPLTVPMAEIDLTLSDASTFSAIELFVDAARRSNPAAIFDDADIGTIGEICRRLDGLALAIERLALRSLTMSPAKMLEHVRSRFHMLDGYHAGPERHRTLTATVNWSYSLLTETERRVCRWVAVFDGSFALEDACTLCATQDLGADEAVASIAALVSKSLLAAGMQDGEMRYWQTNITRAFAVERLTAAGESDDARRRILRLGMTSSL